MEVLLIIKVKLFVNFLIFFILFMQDVIICSEVQASLFVDDGLIFALRFIFIWLIAH